MQIIDLRVPDLRKTEVGTKVITSKGFEFVLLDRDAQGKESWKDETSGLIWYDIEDSLYTWNQAMEKFKDKLPTKEEFQEAETHGSREVLPNIKNRWCWSSSGYQNGPDYAYDFYGVNGGIYVGYRYSRSSVRCVGRR